MSASANLLSIRIKYERTDILRNDLSTGTFKLDQLLQVCQRQEAIGRQVGGRRPGIGRPEHSVLEEVRELLDVEAIVLAVELLEYRDQSVYVVRTVYRELHRLVLPHDTAKSRIVSQVLEHT